MNKILFFIIIALITFMSFSLGALLEPKIYKYLNTVNLEKNITTEKEKPLDRYSIENLSSSTISPSEIIFDKEISTDTSFDTNQFSISFNPDLTESNLKKVTGMINIPKSDDANKKYPIILMLRGYVDQETYVIGTGTKSAANFFSNNDFITIAPDFLGYGESDTESGNIFESRFQTYVTAITILKSLKSIDKWNGKDVFIWGHSNGGQIALTLLEITRFTYPTTLWAPVSKPFPYSILYYTDESDDKGKFIRKELSKFEEDYDVFKYSIENYYDRIKAPIQIHQGTVDDAVPIDWSRNLNINLKDLEIDTVLYIYHGADHNLKPSWNTVVERDLEFFRKYVQN